MSFQVEKVKIIDSKTKVKQNPYYNKYVIPNHPSRVCFSGKSASGKTNLCCFILGKYFKKYYTKVYVFSPTIEIDDNWRCKNLQSKKMEIIGYSGYDDEILQEIVDEQKEIINQDGIEKSDPLLIIFDDVASDKEVKKSKLVLDLFFSGRHVNASIWFLTQSYNQLPRKMRLNLTNVFIYPTSNQQEINIIESEHGSPYLDKKQFVELFKYATKTRYSFLHVNKQTPEPSEIYRKNLNQILKLKN